MNWKPIIKQISIKAPAEKVWNVLLDEQMYRIWAREFSEGSYYINTVNFALDSKVVFTDSSMYGLIGKVTINEPNKKIQFTYEGQIAAGLEDYTSDEVVNGLKGVTETYVLTEKDGATVLDVEAAMGEEWFDDMSISWDKALQAIKKLSEIK